MSGLEDPGAALLAWVALVIVGAGLVHGTLGLGFPLFATPLLALAVDVRTAIVLTLVPTAAVNVASIVRGGRWGRSVGRFWPLAAGAVLGASLGARLLVVSDPAPFKLLLATLVLLYLAGARAGRLDLAWTRRHFVPGMVGVGIVAGMAAGTTNVMVPILIIYTLELGLERTEMVQVFNLCFLAGKLSQIGVFGASGLLDAGFLLATAPLAAIALAALWAGMRVRDRIPTDLYRRIVRGVLLALALTLIAQYLAAAVPV